MSNAGVLPRRHRVSNPEPFGRAFLSRGEGHHAATGDLYKVAALAPPASTASSAKVSDFLRRDWNGEKPDSCCRSSE